MTAPTAEQAQAAYQAESDLAAARRRLGLALPDGGWLGDYVRNCVPLTDAPVEFHVAAGLGALSTAIGNRCWVAAWGQRTFPHIWMVLVASSSFWRKSTSINLAEGLLRDAVPEAVFPNVFTPEKFLGVLSGQPWGLVSLKEFGGFLANAGKDYNSGLKEILTELYDGPATFKRSLQSGEIVVHDPAITILGASTLDWLESRVTVNDLGSGFFPRFLFVTAATKTSPKGTTDLMDAPARNELVRGLRSIANRGPAPGRFTPEAKARIDDFMLSWEAESAKHAHAVDVTGFANRLQTAALKLSVLYTLSERAWELTAPAEPVVLEIEAVERALAYVRILYRNVTGLIDDDIATTKSHQIQRQVLRIAANGTSWSDLLRFTHMLAKDLRPYVETLVETGELAREQRTPAEVGLERARQKPMEWLVAAPKGSRNGSHVVPDTVRNGSHEAVDLRTLGPYGSQRTVSEPEGGEPEANRSEPYLSHSHTESLTVRSSHDPASPSEGGHPARAPRVAPTRGEVDELPPSDSLDDGARGRLDVVEDAAPQGASDPQGSDAGEDRGRCHLPGPTGSNDPAAPEPVDAPVPQAPDEEVPSWL